MNFSEYIGQQMSINNISIEELRLHCGVSRVSASKWVNGHVLPHVIAWHQIADLLSKRSGDPISQILWEMSKTIPT